MDWPHEDCLMGQICKTGSAPGKELFVYLAVLKPLCSAADLVGPNREDVLPVQVVSLGETAWLLKDSFPSLTHPSSLGSQLNLQFF